MSVLERALGGPEIEVTAKASRRRLKSIAPNPGADPDKGGLAPGGPAFDSHDAEARQATDRSRRMRPRGASASVPDEGLSQARARRSPVITRSRLDPAQTPRSPLGTGFRAKSS